MSIRIAPVGTNRPRGWRFSTDVVGDKRRVMIVFKDESATPQKSLVLTVTGKEATEVFRWFNQASALEQEFSDSDQVIAQGDAQ